MKKNFKPLSNLLLNGPHDGRLEIRINSGALDLLEIVAKQNNKSIAELTRLALDSWIDAAHPCPLCYAPAFDPRELSLTGSVNYICYNCGHQYEIQISDPELD